MRLPNGYGSVVKLSGNRRKPYIVRKTVGWKIDEKNGKISQQMVTIGYAKTKKEGLQMLAEYNNDPYDVDLKKMTFKEVYESWLKNKSNTISKSTLRTRISSYNNCKPLHDKIFSKITTNDLQYFFDNCGRNYPMMNLIQTSLRVWYDYAIENDIVRKNMANGVILGQYKDRNPNRQQRDSLTENQIKALWSLKDDENIQLILILIYTGVRIGELLNLKKEDVNLDKKWFEIKKSKTDAGRRIVPIADKILPFFYEWYDKFPNSDFLVSSKKVQKKNCAMSDTTFRVGVLKKVRKKIDFFITAHNCRHTCISLLTKANVNKSLIMKIVGHSGNDIEDKVYVHFEFQDLLNAINKI